MSRARPGSIWRWVERDPNGTVIHLSEETWTRKAIQRPEIIAHEEAIRVTIRDPDAIFYDRESSRQRLAREAVEVAIVHYVALGRTHGRQTGNFVTIVVRWEYDRTAGRLEGFIHTMLLPDAIQPRLELIWERHP